VAPPGRGFYYTFREKRNRRTNGKLDKYLHICMGIQFEATVL